MKNFYDLFLCSSKELKNVRNLVTAGLLIAIKLILDLFTIQFTPIMHLSFEFLASATISMLFGPVSAAMCLGLSDIINYIINPQGIFFPGYTIAAMILGIIYGIILYKKKVTIIRCIVAEVVVTIVINLLLYTFFASLLYGKAFIFLISTKLLKNIIMIPINGSLMYFILNLVNKVRN